MDKKLFEILENFRPCFSRKATYYWFTLVMIGLAVRADHYGISSIVRWVSLSPNCYFSLLHFFGSTGWTLEVLLLCWWSYCLQDPLCLKIQGRAVLLGDHTNQPKGGQRMPGVVTIHQHSETSSKPSYFRGHVWGFIALVMGNGQKYFAVPLKGELNLEERNKENSCSLATQLVYNAIQTAQKMGCPAYLVLDAFFAIGPVFLIAVACSVALRVPWVHIITRAKKNAVAYLDPPPDTPGKRGRKRKYGEKVKLMGLFKERANEFLEETCFVYGHTEVVKILCLDLLWKPIKGKIRFVLAITSRGPIVLMSSDLTLPAVQILELYCQRASIESMFLVLKHSIGGL
ncbi:transposase, partial [bacterium]|nr:transposase [bacterium]